MAMRSFRADFTGAEDYVDVQIVPAMNAPAVCVQGISQDDAVKVIEYTLALIGGAAVRVTPTDRFVGRVDFCLVDL